MNEEPRTEWERAAAEYAAVRGTSVGDLLRTHRLVWHDIIRHRDEPRHGWLLRLRVPQW